MAPARLSLPQQRFVFTGIGVFLGMLALLMPYLDVAEPASFVGGLLVWAAILEILHGFRRVESLSRLSAWFSGGVTLLIGTLMINAILFQRKSLVDFIFTLFAIDAARYLFIFFRSRMKGRTSWGDLVSGIGNGIVVVLILIFRGRGVEWVIGLSGALRILGTVYHLFNERTGTVEKVDEDIVAALGAKGNLELETLAAKVRDEEERRAPLDAGWIISLIVILFIIHLGRMGLDRSALGILSPLVAVIGDIFVALIFAFAFMAPVEVVFRRFTGLFPRRLWGWVQQVPENERKTFSLRTLSKLWLTRQMRISIRMRKSGYSFITAFRNGLKSGLPFAALLAAIMPVLGMSWYFDTENWASGIWDGWAGSRTEVWREAMINASGEKVGPASFKLHPKGVSDTTDFSFVVIGDPGEGDPSQHVLKDQILAVSNKTDINFVVVSSDIVYPSGAMRDYERKFFLPFKGVTKPMYAIPGNHDWYDALDAFVATFFTPEAARLAMEARVASDLKLSPKTEIAVDQLIHQTSFLRREYQISTGHQRAPFFQISNDYFLFLAIDTGVRRRVDALQWAWIKAVLEASKGKYVMALLGHPFYAISEYQGDMNPDFRALHQLLREYKVQLVMAGDTHDLEYYKELQQEGDGHVMHHFVNGGGGAYLSIGAAMAPASTRPAEDWAIYPARVPLMQKIDTLTPRWKFPAWMWLKKFDGYPFSAEWLSAAFDYNQAPYFQSFMEIKVERSKNRIRLIPYGIHGQLIWSDFDLGGKVKPTHAHDTDKAEWVFPLKLQ